MAKKIKTEHPSSKGRLSVSRVMPETERVDVTAKCDSVTVDLPTLHHVQKPRRNKQDSTHRRMLAKQARTLTSTRDQRPRADFDPSHRAHYTASTYNPSKFFEFILDTPETSTQAQRPRPDFDPSHRAHYTASSYQYVPSKLLELISDNSLLRPEVFPGTNRVDEFAPQSHEAEAEIGNQPTYLSF